MEINTKEINFEENYFSNLSSKNNFFSICELYEAYCNCKKGKNSINSLKFEEKLEENLFELLDDLNNGKYEISRAICFIVEKPKIREIWASDFRDRIVHHLLIRKIEIFYENKLFPFSFLESSFANRKNKGTHKAVIDLKKLIKSNKYYLKFDIMSFFNSIDREILYKILVNDLNKEEFVNKEVILKLFKKIIFHKYTLKYQKKSKQKKLKKVPFHKSLFSSEPINKGLPIGNLTSQFLSNVYLNKLDYFIEKELSFNFYLRYVDDGIILSNNKEELENLIFKINDFLQKNLSLELHPKKIILREVKEGVDFLGFFVKPKYTLVRKNVVLNLKQKLYYFFQNKKNNKLTRNEVIQVQNIINSYYGHFKHGNSYNLKWKMSKKLTEYFELKKKKNNLILKQKNNLNFENVQSQYLYFKQKYKNHLIIFQMGNFYRFFDEQAEFISEKLQLKIQIKKYSKKKHLICGFPIKSKKFLIQIENLNINYCMVKQLNDELSSGLKERIEDVIVSNKEDLYLSGRFEISQSEDLNSILEWDLNSMSPIEVFMKLDKLIKNYKK